MQRRRPFCLLLDGGVRAEPPPEDGRQQDDAKHVPVALAKVVAEVAERDELKDEGGLAKCRVYRGAVRVARRREYVEGGAVPHARARFRFSGPQAVWNAYQL